MKGAPPDEGVAVNYCLQCGWFATRRDNTAEELAASAVEHAVDTGHDVESDVRSLAPFSGPVPVTPPPGPND